MIRTPLPVSIHTHLVPAPIAPSSAAYPFSTAEAGHSSGIDLERLDPSVRQAAELLFPKRRGLTLLADLVRIGDIEQRVSNDSEPIAVAVVRLASVEQFARQHAQSKDTILRYLTVLEALQIISRRRTSEATEIRIPLAPWSPDEAALSGLDGLLQADAARDKLQQLAAGVKERFLLLYGSPQTKVSLFDELIAALSDIQELLHKRVSATKRQLLQVRIDTLMIRLKTGAKKGDLTFKPQTEKGDFSSDQSPSLRAHGSSSPQQATGKGDFSPGKREMGQCGEAGKGDFRAKKVGVWQSQYAEKGDFQGQRAEGWASDSTEKGDFSGSPPPLRASFSTEKGDFQPDQRASQSHQRTQKGDFENHFAGGHAEKGDVEGQSDRMRAEKGDFQPAAPGASLNDNDTIYLDNNSRREYDIDIDAPPARAGKQAQEGDLDRYTPREAASVGKVLAMFLEKSPRNTGGFVNKCKQYPRTVIRAAVIDMLVHSAFPQIDPADERGRPRNRASWFHDACHKYGKPGTPLPGYVRKWLRSDSSFDEIEEQLNAASLRYKRYMLEGERATGLIRQWLAGQIEQQELEAALNVESQGNDSGPTPEEEPPVGVEPFEKPVVVMKAAPRVEKNWMDEGEAEVLAQDIMGDERARMLGISAAKPVRDQGVFVVAVYRRGVIGVAFVMKTPQQWMRYLENIQRNMTQQQREREQRERERGTSRGTAQ